MHVSMWVPGDLKLASIIFFFSHLTVYSDRVRGASGALLFYREKKINLALTMRTIKNKK